MKQVVAILMTLTLVLNLGFGVFADEDIDITTDDIDFSVDEENNSSDNAETDEAGVDFDNELGNIEFGNTLGSKDLKEYSGTIIKTDIRNILLGKVKYDGEGMANIDKKVKGYETAEAFNADLSGVSGTEYDFGDVADEVINVGDYFGDPAELIYPDWQTADTSDGASKKLYFIITISFRTSSSGNSSVNKLLYGVMWETEKDGVKYVNTYCGTDTKLIVSALGKEADKDPNGLNGGGTSGATHYDEYDTSLDNEIGANGEAIDFELRDFSEDDKTVNRLSEIKQELELRKRQEKSSIFDIALKIGGIIVLIYTVLLVIAYAADTANTVFDVEFVRIITFNRAVCVRDKDDLKLYEGQGTGQYLLTRPRFILYTVIGFVAGVILINTDSIRVFAEAIYSVVSR